METLGLIDQLQQLNRGEKLKILRLLADDLSIDVEHYFEGRISFKNLPPIRATEQAVKLLEELERAPQSDG